jgi:TonB-dependent SusC/RagA subfamily outer membrane receptor
MRLISTLCLLFSASYCFAQPADTSKVVITGNCWGSSLPNSKAVTLNKKLAGEAVDLNIEPVKKDTAKTPARIIVRCRGTFNPDNEPLIIVDGLLIENENIKNLNPGNIERIDILKDAAASALYGYRAMNGVIIITTKSSRVRKFIIKDFLDGSRIAGATVSFISADKKDTMMMVANDSGVVVTDKLKGSVNYEMSVSATGYKLQVQRFKISYDKKEQEVMLEREIKICKEVIITSYGTCHGCRGGYSCTRVSKCSLLSVTDTAISFSYNSNPVIVESATPRVFPNPAQKGKAIIVETISQSGGPLEIKLISMDGRLLFSQPQKTVKGLNRFIINTDPRWSAGIYFVQLYENGKTLASNKVIIQ